MFRSTIPTNIILFALLSFAPAIAGGAELTDSLRKASELYRAGRLSEAREEAASFQRFFPDDTEGLVILGRIEFEAGRYSEARQWFRLASAKSPRHPVVKRYRKLLEELEYRNGPFEVFPLPLPAPDRGETAKRFKKAWFGPVQAASADDLKPPAAEPILSRGPLSASSEAGSTTAAIGMSPDNELETAGEAALKNSFYLKSYLLYSQALARTPDHAPSMLGFARAAIQMGKYTEARDALSPLLSIGAPPESAAEARALAEMARSLIETADQSH